MSQITAEERLEAGNDLSLADIRSKNDYEAETIEGSHNLPIREDLIDGDLEIVQESLAELPDDK